MAGGTTTRPAGRSGRPGGRERWWRALLVAGALGASFLGSELIAGREATLPATPPETVIRVPVRQADGTLGEQRLELAPVPTAVPRSALPTVARSRSSR